MHTQQIEMWLEPLADDVSGPDLEYDPSFLELVQAANGRPETQFGPEEPPSWPLTLELSSALFAQTRDLRLAIMWGRAVINLQGLEGLPGALALVHGLLDRFWNEVHPRPDPDDGDTFARLSILGSLDTLDGMLGDVRQAQLLGDRRLGGVRVRDVEIALDRLSPRADETTFSPGQIEGMLGEHAELGARVRTIITESLQSLKALQALMNERFGSDSAVDTKSLRGMLTAVQSLLPPEMNGADATSGDTPHDDAGNAAPAAGTSAPGSGSGVLRIESRQDAVRAINMVCAYLERSEPTNPAQMLLRRAERLIDKSFLQLVRDFAPDAVNEVARILGVNPDELNSE